MRKVVLITGGARGIGKRLVEDFAKDGYVVAFTYNTSEKQAIQLRSELESRNIDVMCDRVDISIERDVTNCIDKIIAKYGRIDVLINNAATTNDTLFRDKTADSFDKVVKTNLIGTFVISKLVGEIMYNQRGGKIINISSTNGINTYYPMCLEYDASKAGVNSLTHNLAMQFAPYVIVNAVAPGFIATESEVKDMDEEFVKLEEEKIFLRRAGTEEDVSNLIMFLASDKSNYINNQIIKINGGVYGD